jgi:hypothetical protein
MWLPCAACLHVYPRPLWWLEQPTRSSDVQDFEVSSLTSHVSRLRLVSRLEVTSGLTSGSHVSRLEVTSTSGHVRRVSRLGVTSGHVLARLDGLTSHHRLVGHASRLVGPVVGSNPAQDGSCCRRLVTFTCLLQSAGCLGLVTFTCRLQSAGCLGLTQMP